jgi:hypothetical protein
MMPKIVGERFKNCIYLCVEVEEESGYAEEQPASNKLQITQ